MTSPLKILAEKYDSILKENILSDINITISPSIPLREFAKRLKSVPGGFTVVKGDSEYTLNFNNQSLSLIVEHGTVTGLMSVWGGNQYEDDEIANYEAIADDVYAALTAAGIGFHHS